LFSLSVSLCLSLSLSFSLCLSLSLFLSHFWAGTNGFYSYRWVYNQHMERGKTSVKFDFFCFILPWSSRSIYAHFLHITHVLWTPNGIPIPCQKLVTMLHFDTHGNRVLLFTTYPLQQCHLIQPRLFFFLLLAFRLYKMMLWLAYTKWNGYYGRTN
jgi:hypothetical protein